MRLCRGWMEEPSGLIAAVRRIFRRCCRRRRDIGYPDSPLRCYPNPARPVSNKQLSPQTTPIRELTSCPGPSSPTVYSSQLLLSPFLPTIMVVGRSSPVSSRACLPLSHAYMLLIHLTSFIRSVCAADLDRFGAHSSTLGSNIVPSASRAAKASDVKLFSFPRRPQNR